MANKCTAIWCEHAYGVYSAYPIVKKLQKRERDFVVILPRKLIEKATSFFDVPVENLRPIEGFTSKFGGKFTLFFRNNCIRTDFSEIYYQRLCFSSTKEKTDGINNNGFYKIPNHKLNIKYVTWCKFFTKIGLIKKIPNKYSTIISFTKNHHSYALAARSNDLISIMESWDHPAQLPYLITPRFSFTWNKDLIADTKQYQFEENTKALFPAKFNYIIDNLTKSDVEVNNSIKKERFLEDLEWIKGNKTVVYPVCSSSNWVGFDGELAFIKDLSEAVTKAGCKLYIRCYPLAPEKDIELLSAISNSYVGLGSGYLDGSDVLDSEVQAFKYLINRYAHCVVNLGTTFAHDAALSNAKVLQLELVSDHYGIFTEYSKGLHIRKYLLNDLSLKFSDNQEELVGRIKNPDDGFSNYLNAWLKNER